MKTIVCVATLAICGALTAQTFTSPKGYDTVEGAGSHGHILGSVNGLTWQQIDSTLKGPGFQNIKSIAWRRDGSEVSNAVFQARVFEQMSVVLAHATLGTISGNLAGNYKGAPVTVFDPKNVNAPDWTSKPASAPAPFNLKLVFDRPWTYNGQDDLLWEVNVQKVTPTPVGLVNYPYDFQNTPGSFMQVNNGVSIGQGCIAKGQTANRFVLSATLEDYGTRFQLRQSVNFAPRDSLIVGFLDTKDPNLTVPGLCGAVHALPTIALIIGTGSPGGSVPSAFLSDIPYDGSLINKDIYLQAIGVDDSQANVKIAVSQGKRVTVPAAPTLPAVGRVHSYVVANLRVTYGPWTGGVITQFEY